MNFAKFSVRRPIATLMALLVVISFGVLSIMNINVALMPNLDIPVAIVITNFQGVGSAEVENLITAPLEGVLGTVPGLSEIESTTNYGQSIIVLQFNDGVDISTAALDMRERIDMIRPMLPSDASAPMVMQIDINAMNSFMLGITPINGDIISLGNSIENSISSRLERLAGVAAVNVAGALDTEIEVVLREDQLRGFGISEAGVVNTLRAENTAMPVGSIQEGRRTMSMRVSGEFETIADIASIPIATPFGNIVQLRDFADVNHVIIEGTSVSLINNVPNITLTIQSQSDANAVNVSANIMREVEQLRQDFPNYEFTVIIDPATFINRSIANVVGSAVLGSVFAIAVLYFFLRNFRSSLVVGVAIPVSIMATFVLMHYADISLNMMSMGGLALGIGMLVDNSVVVLESIFRKIEEGDSLKNAAVEGTREVASSVLASTLTTVAVFLPLTFAGGMAAQIFNQLALTIAFSLMSSLFVALTFVPMACSVIIKAETVIHHNVSRFLPIRLLHGGVGRILEGVNRVYLVILKFSLRRRWVTYLCVLGFTVLTAVSLMFVNMEFMAETDESIISVNISMPRGTLLEDTEAVLMEVADRLSHFEEVEDFYATSGGGMFGGGVDSGQMFLLLSGAAGRERSAAELVVAMEPYLRDIPGASISIRAESFAMGGLAGGGIGMRIYGDEREVLSQIATDVVNMLEGLDYALDVTTSIQAAAPQATIRIDRNVASAFGVSTASVHNVVNTAISGTVATAFRVGGNEYDVRVRQNSENFDFITDIQSILIPTANGISLPLHEIAEVVVAEMPITLHRANMQPYVSVTAGFSEVGVNPAGVAAAITSAMESYIMPAGFTWQFTGAQQEMNETFTQMLLALLMAILLVYMIMAAQFESFIFPFIVMFSIPVAMTGGIFGLFVLGNSFDITAFMGLIMLAGIVINNAIIMIDYTNLLIRERGMQAYDAVVKAGRNRLRPILMTSLTTSLGLVPLLVSNADGAEMMRGLATVIVSGLSLSTLVTTVLIPSIYISIDNRKNKGRARKQRRIERRQAKLATRH